MFSSYLSYYLYIYKMILYEFIFCDFNKFIS